MGSNSLNRFLAAFIASAFFFVFACSSGSDDKLGNMDGTWQMDDFTLEISGNNYILKMDGVNETKGTVIYDASTFEFIITHEWDGRWIAVPASVRIFGNYERNNEVSAFSEVYIDYGYGPQSYYMFDGEWRKIR